MVSRARRLWTVFEVVHAPVYFAPEPLAAYAALGLHGYWRGYYAGRVAPLGAVGADPVVRYFHGFARRHVERALPSIWELTSPAAALDARLAGVRDTLARAWAGLDDTVLVAERLLTAAVDGADLGGRPLGSANRDVERPADPIGRVWHAATVLREARGDGHVTALRRHGIRPCESLVLRAGLGTPRSVLQPNRGWTDEEWEATADDLRDRGLLDAGGAATDAGRQVERAVEALTDELADSPWATLGDRRTDDAYSALSTLAEPLRAMLPWPNPMALPPTGT
ncbi:hypothetical protein PZ938_00350 [Luteipulveratus sp. YIM 133132]|uniref:SCO6745 family protein n=1 Tax=Luteipulveratus flavus TaxID=3031728 RepID=UPI0023AEE595|nr:hypothetical protein [Luteipulveratus sp. YIM 133132]MDE9364044.1 hypothetical protein [Luteipulveratus sp. YIM 133132]